MPGWIQWLGVLPLVWFFYERYKQFRQWLLKRESSRSAPSRSKAENLTGAGLAIVCAFLWSLGFFSIGLTTPNHSVWAINAVILGSATIFLFLGSFVVRMFEKKEPATTASALHLSSPHGIVLLFATVGNFVLSVYALYYISISQTMTLTNLFPLFLVLIMLVRQEMSWSNVTISTVLLVATGTLITNLDEGLYLKRESELIGSFVAVVAGLSFAFYAYQVGKVEKIIENVSTRMRFLAMVFCGAFATVLTVAHVSISEPISASADLAILVANGFRVALVYVIYHEAVRRAGVLIPATIVVLQVPLTMFWDARFLGTPMPRPLMIGAFLIVMGVVTLLVDELSPHTESSSPREFRE